MSDTDRPTDEQIERGIGLLRRQFQHEVADYFEQLDSELTGAE